MQIGQPVKVKTDIGFVGEFKALEGVSGIIESKNLLGYLVKIGEDTYLFKEEELEGIK